MPLTFSAGSFSFLKSSTSSQSNIKQNNNVDNVNKNNNIVNDNLDISNKPLVNLPLNNNINIIPLERRVRSLDNSTPTGNNRRNSNASSNLKNTNRKAWFKTLFGRIHHTLSRWSDADDDEDNNNNNNNENGNDRDCSDNIIKNKDKNDDDGIGVGIVAETEIVGDDDDPIIMKSSINKSSEKRNSFIHHGNTHDFYIVTKNDTLKQSYSSNNLDDDNLKTIPSSSTGLFEKCAQTPRHFAKESEVLAKVGRFTIVREPENFDTTYFDKCHCQQKPCRFSTNGCCGTHPISPPESLPKLKFNEIDFPLSRYPYVNLPQNLTPQQYASAIAYHQAQLAYSSSSNKNDSWPSSKSRRSFYSNNASSNSSMHSLSSLQKHNMNGACPMPIMGSKATILTSSAPSNSNSNSISSYSRVLPQSSSSPNLVHLNQRSKIESVQNKNTSRKNNNNGRPNMNIIVGGGNSGKYSNPPTNNNNGSYYSQCNNNNNNNNNVTKSKKSSLVNMKAKEEQQRRSSMPPTSTSTTPPLIINSSSTPSTPTTPSKFSLSHPNEPHTTINSHSGRKFEVEWNTTAKSSSSSSTSSTSSSDTSYSPPSTISSVFSMGSSPDKKSTTNNTLSRRCSTLSSKCGRKFEVTILSSSSGNNCILNTSPHSTINSINSVVSSPIDTNMDLTKC